MDTYYELSIRTTIRNIGTSIFPNYELHITYTVNRSGLTTSVDSRTEGYRSFAEAKLDADMMVSLIETANSEARGNVRAEAGLAGRNLGA